MARLQLLILSTSITFSHKKGVSSYRAYAFLFDYKSFYLKAPNKAAMLGRLIKAFTKTEPRTAGIV